MQPITMLEDSSQSYDFSWMDNSSELPSRAWCISFIVSAVYYYVARAGIGKRSTVLIELQQKSQHKNERTESSLRMYVYPQGKVNPFGAVWFLHTTFSVKIETPFWKGKKELLGQNKSFLIKTSIFWRRRKILGKFCYTHQKWLHVTTTSPSSVRV